MASNPYGRIYNALSGRELRKTIIREIEDLLDGDERFQNNVTYPKISFKFDLQVKVYPREPEAFTVGLERTFGESEATGVSVEFSQSREAEHPDKVRQDTGQIIPHPQRVKLVGVVDVTGDQILGAAPEPVIPEIEQDDEEEPLIVPATSIPERVQIAVESAKPVPRQTVQVGGAAGARNATIEIDGHNTAPRPIVIPREAAMRVTIANNAALDDNWAQENLKVNAVTVDDKTRRPGE